MLFSVFTNEDHAECEVTLLRFARNFEDIMKNSLEVLQTHPLAGLIRDTLKEICGKSLEEWGML